MACRLVLTRGTFFGHLTPLRGSTKYVASFSPKAPGERREHEAYQVQEAELNDP
jgi:hypothetical protein